VKHVRYLPEDMPDAFHAFSGALFLLHGDGTHRRAIQQIARRIDKQCLIALETSRISTSVPSSRSTSTF